MTRLATLAEGGRITLAQVETEIQRLQWLWQRADPADSTDPVDLASLLDAEHLRAIDTFDQLQLAAVVKICRESRSLSEAGRRLFDRSRTQRSVVNDADRLRKYLHKFGLSWERCTA